MTVAIPAALLGAFCYALAATLQHHEVAEAPASGVAHPRLLWALARRPRWLLGIAAAGVGAALHLLALSRGPLTLVQPLGVTGLLFVIPLAARMWRHRVRLHELVAAAVILGGLGAVLGVLPPGSGTAMTDSEPIVGLVLGAAVVIAATVPIAAALAAGRLRSLVLAVGAAIAFGVTSALARVLLQLHDHSHVLVPALVAGGGVVILAPLGMLLLQNAYRTGSVATGLATLTVVDPLVAAACGVLLLHEPLPQAPQHVTLLAIGALCVTAGIALLARSPVQHRATGHPAEAASESDTTCILIGTDTYPPDVNGAASFTRRLATELAARGHDVHVVCPSADGRPATTTETGVVVHRLRSIRTPFHSTFRICPPPLVDWASCDVLDTIRPDIVHVQGHFLIGRALINAADEREIPLVATNHFMPENLASYVRLPRAVCELGCALAWRDFVRLFDRADQVTTPTPTAAALIRGRGLHSPVGPISCGIDVSRFDGAEPCQGFRQRYGIVGDATVLFVGRLEQEKHVDEIVRALPLIRRDIDAQLVLVGVGKQRRRLEALAERLDVATHVHFLGHVDDADLPDIYAAADLFCMPGTAELQSLATLEAMASGLPAVAADAMALPHLVQHGVNGYLFRPGDYHTLAHHAGSILTSPRLRQRMSRASRRIAENHDTAATVIAYEDLYIRLLSSADHATALTDVR